MAGVGLCPVPLGLLFRGTVQPRHANHVIQHEPGVRGQGGGGARGGRVRAGRGCVGGAGVASSYTTAGACTGRADAGGGCCVTIQGEACGRRGGGGAWEEGRGQRS